MKKLVTTLFLLAAGPSFADTAPAVKPTPVKFELVPSGHFIVKVGVSRRNDTYVGVQRARRPDALEFAGLDDAQQFGLLIHRDIGDFIHEQCALIRQLEPSGPIGFCVGEGSFDVTKQLAFEKRLR